jgi:hypothetical protein
LNFRPVHPAPSALSGPVQVDGTLRSAIEVSMLSRLGKSANVCDQLVTNKSVIGSRSVAFPFSLWQDVWGYYYQAFECGYLPRQSA